MNHCFLVTSSIEVDAALPFKDQYQRTVFYSSERLRQTIATVTNLNVLDPKADIIIIDNSETRFEDLARLKKVQYLQLKDLDPTAAAESRTHFSQAYCESIMILALLKSRRLDAYDFITKVDGRYLMNSTFNKKMFTKENTNKFFFKYPVLYSYENLHDSFKAVTPVDLTFTGTLGMFSSHAFAVGREKLNLLELYMTLIRDNTANKSSKYWWVDIEFFLYFYSRIFDLLKDVIMVDWELIGWNNRISGAFEVF